jgi:alpha-1,2-rhamnosyltransferase
MRLREEIDKLQAEVEALRRKKDSMESSLSWRLTAPLRWLDGALRTVKTPRKKKEPSGSFSWLDRTDFRRKGNRILADYSLTVEERSSPGMRRVTKGLLRGAMEEGLPLVPVDLRSPIANDVSAKFGDRGEVAALPVIECDLFLLADASWEYTKELRPFLARMGEAGIPSVALVHDAIPFDHPDLCLPESVERFGAWMDLVFEYCSAVVCVSQYSADRVLHHLSLRHPERSRTCEVYAWLPGNETWPGAAPEDELVPAGEFVLCVGTVEPRKNYPVLLQAMEELWSEGRTNSVLVIFGREGWKTADFVEKMTSHPEWGRRLWWFDGGTDAHLHALYHSCTAFAVPSIDEGFSQSLSEAASLGKPAVLSDLPVFRERVLSGGHFFQLDDMASLKTAVLSALAPGAEPIRLRQATWGESARSMMSMLDMISKNNK